MELGLSDLVARALNLLGHLLSPSIRATSFNPVTLYSWVLDYFVLFLFYLLGIF